MQANKDYVYVSDVVKPIYWHWCKKNPRYLISIAETDVNSIFDRINDFAGANFKEKHGPPNKGEQRRSVLSFGKISNQLGWIPEIDIETGLKTTTEYFKNHKR
jgi:nucleoside-diphosphate-sugar epimerase